jgi:hypothetical protein
MILMFELPDGEHHQDRFVLQYRSSVEHFAMGGFCDACDSTVILVI